MATYVNDGNINWSGNWQACSQVKLPQNSTSLTINNATGRVSVSWAGDSATEHIGCVILLHSYSGTGTYQVALEEEDGTWGVVASTTYQITGTINTYTRLFFKYGASYTETANNFRICVSRTDGTGSINVRADNAASSNVCIACATSTTGTPDEGDDVFVCGTITASVDTPTATAVTIDDAADATIIVGSDTSTNAQCTAISIGNQGTLQYLSTATVDHVLRVKGHFIVWPGGTYSIGVAGAVIPSTRTFTTELNYSASMGDGKYYMQLIDAAGAAFSTGGATLNMQGAARSYEYTTYVSGSGTAADPLITGDTTGWVVNDYLYIFSKTVSNLKKKYIRTISGTDITLADTLGGAESGITAANFTAGTRIHNLTHNVKIKPNNVANEYTIYQQNTATSTTMDLDNVEISGLGALNSGFRIGIGSTNAIDYCSFEATGVLAMNFGGINTTVMSISNSFFFGGTCAIGLDYVGSSNSIAIDKTFSNCTFGMTGGTYGLFAGAYGIYNSSFSGCFFWGGLRHIQGESLSNTFTSCDFTSSLARHIEYGCNDKHYNCTYGKYGVAVTAEFGAPSATRFPVRIDIYSPDLYSSTEMNSASYWTDDSYQTLHTYDLTANRYKTYKKYGIISDQITGGQAEAWARGGSGICVYLDPSSTTNALDWEFYIPVTAATAFTLKFYHKITASFNGSATVTIYDSDDDATILLDEEAVSFTDDSDWHQYTATSKTPTATGFCRVVVKALDGDTTGDIGIDDVTVE